MKKTQILQIIVSLSLAVALLLAIGARIEWPQSLMSQSKSLKAGDYWTDSSSRRGGKAATGVDIAALNSVFTELAERLSPTVVNIYTTSRVQSRQQQHPFGGFGGGSAEAEELFRFFFGNPFGGPSPRPAPRQREATSLGSGFVIHSDGYIVTNSHVVRPTGRNADSVQVKFNTDPADGDGHEAEILGVDPTTDVAVLKLKDQPRAMSVAPLGDSDQTKVGEWAVAIGNPYGHTHSVTQGIVSALGRDISQGLPGTLNRTDFIQTDASINPGNSGGPLFNLYGEVVGINTAIDARAQGIGFAIPINVAKTVIPQIIEHGEVALGWIGVTVSRLSQEIAQSLKVKDARGVLIQDIIAGEPADKAGLQAYDVVVEANGNAINNERDFLRHIASAAVGTELTLSVMRDGRRQQVKVNVGRRPSDEELAGRQSGLRQPGPRKKEAPSEKGAGSIARAGLDLIDISPELQRRLALPTDVQGAVVRMVDSGSAAESIGLRGGDVITEIDRRPVRTAAEASQALGGRKNEFLLRIWRSGTSVIVVLDLSAQN